MRNLISILIIITVFISCDTSKRLFKDRSAKQQTEITEQIISRKGETITYYVPKVKFKDTTIVNTNRVTGTTQVLRYNSDGQVDLAQCISGAIEEINRSNKELIEMLDKKEKTKDVEFQTETILYIMFGLICIVFIVIIALYQYMMKLKP